MNAVDSLYWLHSSKEPKLNHTKKFRRLWSSVKNNSVKFYRYSGNSLPNFGNVSQAGDISKMCNIPLPSSKFAAWNKFHR